VAVISDRLWKGSFASDPNVIGGTIDLNELLSQWWALRLTDFRGTDAAEIADIWLPLTMYAQADPALGSSENRLVARHVVWLQVFGRLKHGVTFEQGQAEMSALARSFERTYPNTNQDAGLTLHSSLGWIPKSGRRHVSSPHCSWPQ